MTAIKKSILILILMISFTLVLTACQTPEEIAFDQICQEENHHKVAVTDGYFSVGASIYCSDVSSKYRCGLVLNSYPDGRHQFSADLVEGKRRNQMLPIDSGYLEQDLLIKTDSGEFVGVGEHVRVTGKLLVVDTVCVMYVDRIEKIE
jgi:hypothetical protein